MRRNFVIFTALILLAMPAMMVMARGAQASGETVVAGVVFQEDQFMRLLSLGYQDAAKEAGYRILLGNTANDQAKEAELVNTYVAQNVAGLAIAPLNAATSLPVLQRFHRSRQEDHSQCGNCRGSGRVAPGQGCTGSGGYSYRE